MSDYEIVRRITIPERVGPSSSDAFEEFMRDEYFPAVFKALPHVGQVTGLKLLRGVTATHEWQYEPTNTFLLHVNFIGLASGDASVDEETQRKFDSFGAQVERRAYMNVAVWPEKAEA